MHLDKDILVKGNKTYSSDTCIFVPKDINSLFTKHDSKRGKYPIGVSYNKRDSKYHATFKKNTIGYYNNPEEAFNMYKITKEKYIKQVADRYKNKIPQRLYDIMYKYIVEITD